MLKDVFDSGAFTTAGSIKLHEQLCKSVKNVQAKKPGVINTSASGVVANGLSWCNSLIGR